MTYNEDTYSLKWVGRCKQIYEVFPCLEDGEGQDKEETE